LLNANERRQKLLAILSIRRHDIVENLAYEFCISKKTVLRDVNLLNIILSILYLDETEEYLWWITVMPVLNI